MLEDDELDFDDFGELGEFEGQEMTTEELEKQLAMEFPDLPLETNETPIKSNEQEKGEIKQQDPIEKPASPPPPETQSTTPAEPIKKPDLDKPLESRPRYPQQNNYNKPNYYNQQQQPMMGMNMYPYPQFSNRIYVNPKFNGGQNQQHILAQQQHQLAQQQLAQQQLRYMELEKQRLALLQQQQRQNNNNNNNTTHQIDLDQKRRELSEMMKKRREQAGNKRKHDSEEDTREAKRQEIIRSTPSGGLSIKGAAAAAAARGIYPTQRAYTPPHKQQQQRPNDIRDRIGQPNNKPSITDRLSTSNKPPQSSSPSPAHTQPVEKKSYVPIVTGGKSNTLIMKGFGGDHIKEEDVKKMISGVNVNDTSIDQNEKTVTVVFNTIEEAVTFRRKYNRFQMGDSYINIVFKK